MKIYRVKVTEKHSDFVSVEAESKEQAEQKAIDIAECKFECVYDCEVVSSEEISEANPVPGVAGQSEIRRADRF